jgi:predicted TIM-barrel fold metal-dependent hydrolase
MNRTLLVGLAVLLAAGGCSRTPEPDALVSYIESIPAVDNHAHVVAPAPGLDKGYDQLRCDGLPPAQSPPPAGFRFGPEVPAAWLALYGFSGTAPSDDALKALEERKDAARKQRGNRYHDWVLQQAGLDVVLANRVAMSPELGAHFRWVPYADALLFPLDNATGKALNPDRRALFGMAEDLLKQYLAAVGLEAPPTTLDDYLGKVVRPTLERQKKEGAVAVKFEAAYLRPLDFQPADGKAASAVYSRFARGGLPGAADYTLLQDFLFGYVSAEAGRLGLAVHIHTGSGCGEFFTDSGADPMLLTPVLNDPQLRKTNFVLLHGGTPNERHVASLIVKPNVYTDTSVQELLFSPAELARILRPWLEVMPERVMFGTDAGPFGPGADWEETTWIGARHARRALALALNGMVGEGVITGERAKEIADRVLRRNAVDLYRLGRP